MIRKPIPYGRQHIIEEDIQAVVNTLKSDYLTQGPKIRNLSRRLPLRQGEVCSSRE